MFLSDAASFKPLAVLRIGLAAILLFQAAVLWRYRELLLSEFGPVPWIVSAHWIDPWVPKLSDALALAARFGIGADGVVRLVLALHAVAALALLLGWRTRWAAFGAWITFVALKSTGYLFTYGVGAMLLAALFFCLFMPVGRAWSLDALRAGTPRGPADASRSVLALRIYMCIVYAGAGISKMFGEQWWTGDAVWRALSLPQFQQFDPTPLLSFPFLFPLAAMGAMAAQLSYPVLVWTPLRVFIVVVAELIHLGIAIFLGLWLFSATMLLLNNAAFGEAVWKAMAKRLRARSGAARARHVRIVYDGACPFCNDYVRYQDLRAAATRVELVDARRHPEVLAEESIAPAQLEDGMVVIIDGHRRDGADAVHALSLLSDPPQRAWVRAVALASRSRPVARVLYPFLKAGRRIALAALGIPRFPR